MTTTLNRKTIPPAFADEADRKTIAQALELLGQDGWTRPAIRAALDSLETPLTDSAVYRAQRVAAHVREVDVWNKFFQAVRAGTVSPPERATRLSAKAIVDNARQAAKVLAALGEKPNAQAMRDAIAKVAELLPAPKADEPEATGGDQPQGNPAEAGDQQDQQD